MCEARQANAPPVPRPRSQCEDDGRVRRSEKPHGHVAAACHFGDGVLVKDARGRGYTHLTLAQYTAWMACAGRCELVVTEADGPTPRDLVYDADFPGGPGSTATSWHTDKLASWWFARHQTGLMTDHERLDALVECAREHTRGPNVARKGI